MKIIDIHTHIYPEEIAQKATDSVRKFYGIALDGTMNGTTDLLLRQAEKAGISKMVILPVAIRPDRVHGINDFILQKTAQCDRIVGFGTVHAAMNGLCDEVDRIMATGLKGLKMHPDSQGFAIDDLRLYPVYDQIQGKIPVLIHMGDKRYDYSHPIRLRKILDSFPRLQVIAAHFGGYSMYETACDLLKDTQCVFDVSSSLMFLKDGEAERYINIYGAERMAFGSDYPMWDPVEEVERFFRLRLTPDQLEQIAYKTAERVLNI